MREFRQISNTTWQVFSADENVITIKQLDVYEWGMFVKLNQVYGARNDKEPLRFKSFDEARHYLESHEGLRIWYKTYGYPHYTNKIDL